MRLESIKLAGFKSFVDPTMVAFPSNLTAIVGPNGCGKSNIIDAIRWVMGESSAKQLRGQSLDDVIFNGCHTRKPLGKASIELNFDNSDARLGGQYSSYTQISIRREITREGQSIYSLNGSRCRRRDIRDIFLGTGLGPRSYAIIEQGMISRIVEAKPEELRAYIEEAAGISKYKERRRESELRLEHTQENLDRLNDLREELSQQLKRLQRQANTAERYKTLKQEERFLKAQLQTLRYQAFQKQLNSQLSEIRCVEEQLNTSQREQQHLLAKLGSDRAQQTQARLNIDQVQTEYYELGNTITRLEENLRTQTTQLQQNQQELADLSKRKTDLEQQCQRSEAKQFQINQTLSEFQQKESTLQSNTKHHQLLSTHAEQNYTEWQNQWEIIQTSFAEAKQKQHSAATQHHYHQQQSHTLNLRIDRLQAEHDEQYKILNPQNEDTDNLNEILASVEEKQLHCKTQQEQIIQKIHAQRARLQQVANALDQLKSRLRIAQGEYASLMALQQEALGKREHTLLQWFKKHNLTEQPRLAQLLQVEIGWERAVEVALDQHIQAVCFTDRASLDDFLTNPPPNTVSLMTKPLPCEHFAISFQSQLALAPISSKFTAPWPLEHLLAGIYVAENVSHAMEHTKQLKSYESIITREGVCLGNHWLRLTADHDHKPGLLQREREITQLKKAQQDIQEQIDTKQIDEQHIQKQLEELEDSHLIVQKQSAELTSQQADLSARYKVQQARITQAKQRLHVIQQELQETQTHHETTRKKLQQTTEEQKIADTQRQHMEKQRLAHVENKEALQHQLNESVTMAKAYEVELHQHELHLQATHHQLNTELATLSSLKQQGKELENRLKQLHEMLDVAENPINSLQQQLNLHVDKRNQLGLQLKESQAQLDIIDTRIKQGEEQSRTLETNLHLDRDALEQQRLLSQELRIRAKTLEEQLQEQGYELEKLLSEIPTIDITECETQLTKVTQGIDQMGAVNLAALEEQHIVSAREHYLETQHKDLTEALAMLQTAIQKMDKETRNRFKETFDRVNQNFTTLFPRLFSGGVATLQLQDSDLLNSGVSIMAQPPGKRNSTIHLLSGGEKALTATALVFSFFQLNPAPFCMLDEVDAPLDDTNVLRFCKLVKELSHDVQFIFISHNKVAIEMAHHLAGVTMHEPGVSRMVAVDLEKAIAIATA